MQWQQLSKNVLLLFSVRGKIFCPGDKFLPLKVIRGPWCACILNLWTQHNPLKKEVPNSLSIPHPRLMKYLCQIWFNRLDWLSIFFHLIAQKNIYFFLLWNVNCQPRIGTWINMEDLESTILFYYSPLFHSWE